MDKKNSYLFIKDLFLLKERKEKEIIITLIRFPSFICDAADNRKPFLVIQYLQNLSKEFQSFYQSIPILQNDNIELSKQRVALVWAVKKVLNIGLTLCGIDSPNFMNKS